jgi:hypothetical protein
MYIYDVKFLALLGAPYIYDISRLRVKHEYNGEKGMKVEISCAGKRKNIMY